MPAQGELACYVQVTEVYQERRLDAVFGMWDQNSDLRISFKELCEGLFRSACYQTAHVLMRITVGLSFATTCTFCAFQQAVTVQQHVTMKHTQLALFMIGEVKV